MTAIELARRAAELRDVKAAQKAYLLALNENNGKDPAAELECAAYLLITQGDADVALSRLVPLFNGGSFQQEAMDLMLQYCYVPAAAAQEKLYQRNMSRLEKYPYFFAGGRAPVPFEDLPVRFFPLGKRGYVAYDQRVCKFGEYRDLTHEAVTHYFNTGSDQPILVSDLYSQYELDYLRDCTRRSEDIARDNHVYLHFSSWVDFCSYAQVLDFAALLAKKKFVFLIEEEQARYPIDWLKDYGKDYSREKVKPIRLEEVNRMIWHVQFSSHNGGDFFNEILDNHPNLIYYSSVMTDSLTDLVDTLYAFYLKNGLDRLEEARTAKNTVLEPGLARTMKQLLRRKRSSITRKDLLVALYLGRMEFKGISPDPAARFAPALLFQPHFHNILCRFQYDLRWKQACMDGDAAGPLRSLPMFNNFAYVKTFLPIRRFTTSYGASIRFAAMMDTRHETHQLYAHMAYTRMVNQGFFHDEGDPLYNDARIVRFEDGKLNPKATFTALARFLDIPYTESMTYCSEFGVKNVETMAGNAVGFDPVTVYRTYDDYTTENINRILEYYLRVGMEQYGYEFQFYRGEEITKEMLQQMWKDEARIWTKYCALEWQKAAGAPLEAAVPLGSGATAATYMGQLNVAVSSMEQGQKIKEEIDNLEKLDMVLRGELKLLGRTGRKMVLTEQIRPDPGLLEQPLYH